MDIIHTYIHTYIHAGVHSQPAVAWEPNPKAKLKRAGDPKQSKHKAWLFKRFVLHPASRTIFPKRRFSKQTVPGTTFQTICPRCRYLSNLPQAPLFKQLVPSTVFQTIFPKLHFSNNLSQAPLFKQFVPGAAFHTIYSRRLLSNNLSQAPHFKLFVLGPAFQQFVPRTDFQTICPMHLISNNLSQAPLCKQFVPGTALPLLKSSHIDISGVPEGGEDNNTRTPETTKTLKASSERTICMFMKAWCKTRVQTMTANRNGPMY